MLKKGPDINISDQEIVLKDRLKVKLRLFMLISRIQQPSFLSLTAFKQPLGSFDAQR